MTVDIAVVLDGEQYSAQIGRIESTMLGQEDHGIMTSYLYLDFGGSGQGAGGYGLDTYEDAPGAGKRVGTAFGMDLIMRILETVGVSKWEDLVGVQILALREVNNNRGTILGIANLRGNKHLIFKQHANQFYPEKVS